MPRKKKKKRRKIIRARRRRGFGSGLEEQFSFFLTELKIEFTKQKKVKRKLYDFYLPACNTLIEVDGDWFHLNRDAGIKLESRIQLKNAKNDLVKNLIAKKNGYKLVRFKEYDIKNNPESVKQQLREINGK